MTILRRVHTYSFQNACHQSATSCTAPRSLKSSLDDTRVQRPTRPHLLRREPLRADDLDRHVIRSMTGFEFGTEDEIEQRLVAILESEGYRRAVQVGDNARTSCTISGLLVSGFVIELVVQEGDDMHGIHRMLSHILRNVFDASFSYEILRTSAVETLCNVTTMLFPESDLNLI